MFGFGKNRTWKIIRKGCRNEASRTKLLQGVNLIMLHSLVRNRGNVSNYLDPETPSAYKKWLETEIDELIKMLKKSDIEL